jgi:hypothetical protein
MCSGWGRALEAPAPRSGEPEPSCLLPIRSSGCPPSSGGSSSMRNGPWSFVVSISCAIHCASDAGGAPRAGPPGLPSPWGKDCALTASLVVSPLHSALPAGDSRSLLISTHPIPYCSRTLDPDLLGRFSAGQGAIFAATRRGRFGNRGLRRGLANSLKSEVYCLSPAPCHRCPRRRWARTTARPHPPRALLPD